MRMASSVEMPSHSSTVVPAGTRCLGLQLPTSPESFGGWA